MAVDLALVPDLEVEAAAQALHLCLADRPNPQGCHLRTHTYAAMQDPQGNNWRSRVPMKLRRQSSGNSPILGGWMCVS
jgi:hypothetical protein